MCCRYLFVFPMVQAEYSLAKENAEINRNVHHRRFKKKSVCGNLLIYKLLCYKLFVHCSLFAKSSQVRTFVYLNKQIEYGKYRIRF